MSFLQLNDTWHRLLVSSTPDPTQKLIGLRINSFVSCPLLIHKNVTIHRI